MIEGIKFKCPCGNHNNIFILDEIDKKENNFLICSQLYHFKYLKVLGINYLFVKDDIIDFTNFDLSKLYLLDFPYSTIFIQCFKRTQFLNLLIQTCDASTKSNFSCMFIINFVLGNFSFININSVWLSESSHKLVFFVY